MSSQNDFYTSYTQGNFYYVLTEQNKEKNLKTYRNTMSVIELDKNHFEAYAIIAGTVLDQAVIKNDFYFMHEAVEITKDRTKKMRELLESEVCFLLLENKDLDKKELEEQTIKFEKLLKSYTSQLEPVHDLQFKFSKDRCFNYDLN